MIAQADIKYPKSLGPSSLQLVPMPIKYTKKTTSFHLFIFLRAEGVLAKSACTNVASPAPGFGLFLSFLACFSYTFVDAAKRLNHHQIGLVSIEKQLFVCKHHFQD